MMRVCEHLGVPIGSLSEEELDLWSIWEQTFGPIGRVRTDLLAAQSLQFVAASRGVSRIPDIDTLMLFKPRDWRKPEVIAAEKAKTEEDRFRRLQRAAAAGARYKKLLSENRIDDWNKEVSPEGMWLGPITDRVRATASA